TQTHKLSEVIRPIITGIQFFPHSCLATQIYTKLYQIVEIEWLSHRATDQNLQYHTRAQLLLVLSTFRIIEVSFFVLSETFFNNILCAFFFYFSFSLLFHALSEQHFISLKHIPSIASRLLAASLLNCVYNTNTI
ncbi:hypothetical protein ACJX0J_032839, partial [Zea mays]